MHTAPPRSSTSTPAFRAACRRLALGLALPLLFASVSHACDVSNLPGCFLEVRTDLAAVLKSTGKSLGSDVTSVKSFTTSNAAVMESLRSALNIFNGIGPSGTFSTAILQRLQDNQQLLVFLAESHDPSYEHFLGASCPDSYCSDFRSALVDLLDNFAAALDQAGQLALAETEAWGAEPIVFPTARDTDPISHLVQSAPPALLFPLWKGLQAVDVGSAVSLGCSPDNTPCTVVRQISDLLARVAVELPPLTQVYRDTALAAGEWSLRETRTAGPYDPASPLCGALLSFGPSNISVITTVVNGAGLLLGAIGAELIANQYFLSLTRANVGASVGAEATAGMTFDPGKWLGWVGKGIQTLFGVTSSVSETVLACRTIANQQLMLCMQRGDAYDVCYDDILHQTPGRVPGF